MKINFNLDTYPDPMDLYPVAPTRESQRPNRKAATLMYHLLHLPTLCALETDESIAWPRSGKLTVRFTLNLPLFCTQIPNAKEVKQSEIAYKEGRADTVVAADYHASELLVLWERSPTVEEANYRGLWPEVVDIVPICQLYHRLRVS